MKSGRIMRGLLLCLLILLSGVIVSCASADFKRIHKDIKEVENPAPAPQTASVEIGVMMEEGEENFQTDEELLTPLYKEGMLLPPESHGTEKSYSSNENKGETEAALTFLKAEKSSDGGNETPEEAAPRGGGSFSFFSQFSSLDFILLSVCLGFFVIIIVLVIVLFLKNRVIRREKMRRRAGYKKTTAPFSLTEKAGSSEVRETFSDMEKSSEKTKDIFISETETDKAVKDVSEDTAKERPHSGEKQEETYVSVVSPAEKPATEEPVSEEPVSEEPVSEEPAAEEPAAEEPAAEEPRIEEEESENQGEEDSLLSSGSNTMSEIEEAAAVLERLLEEESKEKKTESGGSEPTLEEILRMLKE